MLDALHGAERIFGVQIRRVEASSLDRAADAGKVDGLKDEGTLPDLAPET
jgi:hypothetical protein